MKKVRLLIPLLIVFTLVILVSVSLAQEYNLKYNLAKGTKFSLKASSNSDQIQEAMGNENSITGASSSESNCTVLAADDNTGFTLEYEYVKRTNESEGPMGGSSDDYSELSGKKVKYVLAPNGMVSNFEGFETLPVVERANGQKIDKDRYIASVKNIFPKLPEKPVKIGDTWTDTSEDTTPMESGSLKATTNFTYTLLEAIQKDGKECVKIERKYTQTRAGDFEQMGNTITMSLKSVGTDIIYFDHKNGMLLNIDTSSTSEGTADVTNQGVVVNLSSTSKGTLIIGM